MVGIDGRYAAGDPTWFDNPPHYRVDLPYSLNCG